MKMSELKNGEIQENSNTFIQCFFELCYNICKLYYGGI